MLKNFLHLFVSMILSTVCSFLCFAVLGQKMSVEDYGQFNSMIALASAVAVFINNVIAGIVANREIALDPGTSRNLLKRIGLVRTVIFIVGAVALLLYLTIHEKTPALIIAGVIAMLFADSFWELFEQIVFGLKETRFSMIFNSISSVLWLLAVVFLPADLSTVGIVLVIYGVINTAKTVAYGRASLQITKPYRDAPDTLSNRYLFSSSFPYLYNRILGIVSTQIPILLLDGYAGLAETAYYSAGEKFTAPISKLTMVVISAIFPFLTTALRKNRRNTGTCVVDVFQITLSFGACLCLLLCGVSDLVLIGFFGDKYANAAEAFNYQIWFAVVLSADSFFSMLLSSDFKQKTLSVVTTIDALSLIPFLALGLQYGAKGIAMAKLLHSTICLFYHLIITSKYFGERLINVRLIISWVIFVSLAGVGVFTASRWILLFVTAVSFVAVACLNIPTLKRVYGMVRKKNDVEEV